MELIFSIEMYSKPIIVEISSIHVCNRDMDNADIIRTSFGLHTDFVRTSYGLHSDGVV